MSAFALTEPGPPVRLRLMTPASAADRYLDELARDGRAASTRHRYKRYLYELDAMYPYVDVEDLTPAMWVKWLDRICKGASGQDLDRDTISQRVAIAKKFTDWLLDAELIPADPLKRVKGPKRKNPVENDSIVWVTPEETRRMIAVARRDMLLETKPKERFRKALCLGVLGYTGARRAAVSELRIKDYVPATMTPEGEYVPATLTFHEKGNKLITKPISRVLADLIQEAQLAGVWTDPKDYLVPSLDGGRPASTAKRDSRLIYKLVKQVAADAKVNAHVHAIRAAFACIFLEEYPDQLTALKNLMGHSQSVTTEIYLRRMNRQKGMEVVVDLNLGDTTFHAFPATEKEGFEPSFPANPERERQ